MLPHACTCSVCNTDMLDCVQIAEKEQTVVVDDGEEVLPAASSPHSEGFLEAEIIALPTLEGGDTTSVIGGIAALSRGQAILMEKMTFLEKIVGTVQFDMTWVRDDMKSVQQTMLKFDQHVGVVTDADAEVESLKEEVSVDGSPLQPWEGNEHVEDCSRPPSLTTKLVQRACGANEVTSCNASQNVGGHISEGTLAVVKSPGTIAQLDAVEKNGRRDWGGHISEGTHSFVESPETKTENHDVASTGKRDWGGNIAEGTVTFAQRPETITEIDVVANTGRGEWGGHIAEATLPFVERPETIDKVAAVANTWRRDWGGPISAATLPIVKRPETHTKIDAVAHTGRRDWGAHMKEGTLAFVKSPETNTKIDAVAITGRRDWGGHISEAMLPFVKSPQTITEIDAASNMGRRDWGGHVTHATLPFVKSPESNTKVHAVANTGRGDWGYVPAASPDMGSPPCQQPRPIIQKVSPDDETQYMEMYCQSTQPQTPASERSMWSDFAAAVRDWPPPPPAVTGREEGWVRSKKGRWDLTNYAEDITETRGAPIPEEHGVLNVTSLLLKEGTTSSMRGVGEHAAFFHIADTPKNGGSATWRGTARGRRPPAAQPRYHTEVRVTIMQHFATAGSTCLHRPGSTLDAQCWTSSV